MSLNLEQLVQLQKELDAVRIEEKKLEQAVKLGIKTREEADKELQALAATERSLKNDMKAVAKEIDNNVKAYKAAEGSIVELRASLANLRKQYEELSKAERESAKGEDLLNKIQSTTTELKKLEEQQGDYRRSVGNYARALDNVNPAISKLIAGYKQVTGGTNNVSLAFKNAIQYVKGLGKQFVALLSNPIVAGIAAISAVVLKLVDSFKKNDEAMTELKAAFSAFKPILDIIEKGFQKLVGVVTKVVSAIGKVVKTVVSFVPGMKDYANAEEDIVRATDNLEEAERQYTVNHAEREAEISELREKAVDGENYTFKERKKFLEQAQKLEKEDLEERKANATEKVRIAEKEALLEIGYTEMSEEAWAKLSDEQKNHITELRAELSNAETEYNKAARKFTKEKQSLSNQEKAENERKAKEAAQTAKERAEKELSTARTLEELYIQSISDMREKEYSLVKTNGERKIEDLKTRLETEKNLTKKARENINRMIILEEADLQLKLGQMRDNWRQQTIDDFKNKWKQYIEWAQKATDDDTLKMGYEIELNKLDTQTFTNQINEIINQEKNALKSYENDLKAFEDGAITEDEILAKYNGTFQLREIDFGNTLDNMRELVSQHRDELDVSLKNLNETKNAIIEAGKKEEQRIIDEYTKNQHDKELQSLDLTRKHAEILRAIELESNYDAYGQNEIEKTRILKEQAEERLQVARDEYSRISGEREKYTDQELKAIYGSLEAYDNAVLEANLKVVESENDVKEAVKAVTDASTNQKITMIQNATSIMGSIDSILGSMQSLFETMAEDNEKYSDWATAMAMMQILVSTAISIANAIEGATAAGAATGVAAPLTTPAFITEMVAIVVGAITSATSTLIKAKQAKKSSPKFAVGGVIGGGYAANTAEGTRDDVNIRASRGEYIINAESVKKYGIPFFDSLNGGKSIVSVTRFANGGYISDATINSGNLQFQMDMTREMMVEAMNEIQPVVSVLEITKAQNRVQMAENLSQR